MGAPLNQASLDTRRATGRTRGWCDRHTSATSDYAKIPHAKIDGELTFKAGGVRTWFEASSAVSNGGVTRAGEGPPDWTYSRDVR